MTEARFELDEYPWPKKGDDPFALINGSRLIACLNFTHDAPWSGYAEGFKRHGDLAVAYVEETGSDQDFLVYPIVFSYRHYIELSLKLIIRSARRLLDKSGDVPATHSLTDLWNTAEPLLKEIEPKSTATYRDVRECLAHFGAMDPTSESFRYPVKTSGETSLPEEMYHLDLGHQGHTPPNPRTRTRRHDRDRVATNAPTRFSSNPVDEHDPRRATRGTSD